MRIVWDPRKAQTNLRKHGVRFADAESVLLDPQALTREDDTSQTERRFISMGLDAIGRIVVVVYGYDVDEIRVISARRATARERRQYEKGI